MTITGPCPGNDPLKSEGHPKNLLKKSATPRHAMPLWRCLLARTRSNTTTFNLKIKVLHKVLRGKAGLGFLFYYSFGSFLFLFSFSRGGEPKPANLRK